MIKSLGKVYSTFLLVLDFRILTDVLQELTASIISMMSKTLAEISAYGLLITVMMEAISSCETTVSVYQVTQCSIPDDSHLQCTVMFGLVCRYGIPQVDT
jgi:hypothetical protein